MELNEYQERAMQTCTRNSHDIIYMGFGLTEEAGELAGKLAKAKRAGKYGINPKTGQLGFDFTAEELKLLRKECGDVLWMLAGVCDVMGWNLNQIAYENLKKLEDRKLRGVIEGSGDER